MVMVIAGLGDGLGQRRVQVCIPLHIHTQTCTCLGLLWRDHEYRKGTSMYILCRMHALYMLYSTHHVHPCMIQ